MTTANTARMPIERRYFRVCEAAQHLTLSRSAVYALMDRGELGYVKFGKSRRIPVEAIERLVAANTK